ncbi:MAG: hypothetical protein IH861_03395 [Chloroflexi bacterium]|nr:hypothetical protein [Chloroflexota bacterium]
MPPQRPHGPLSGLKGAPIFRRAKSVGLTPPLGSASDPVFSARLSLAGGIAMDLHVYRVDNATAVVSYKYFSSVSHARASW